MINKIENTQEQYAKGRILVFHRLLNPRSHILKHKNHGASQCTSSPASAQTGIIPTMWEWGLRKSKTFYRKHEVIKFIQRFQLMELDLYFYKSVKKQSLAVSDHFDKLRFCHQHVALSTNPGNVCLHTPKIIIFCVLC